MSSPSGRLDRRSFCKASAASAAGLSMLGMARGPVLEDEDFTRTGANIPAIKVDQFGYLPAMQKVAVLSNPVEGFNASQSYAPGDRLVVVRANDGKEILDGVPLEWSRGETDPASGDQVWWFDFSELTRPDQYYILDKKRGVRSYGFAIDDGSNYQEVLKHAIRTFYFQRCGIAKKSRYLNDSASHKQDKACGQFGGKGKVRDLSGGWYDAGDYNKYIGYIYPAVHRLLFAYECRPEFWGDFSLDIPESGNRVPDLLNEIKWELDWILKMQVEDGSFLHLVGCDSLGGQYYGKYMGKPASQDKAPRWYIGPSGQATVGACSMLAHAAVVFDAQPSLKEYAASMARSAERAWQWIQSSPASAFERVPDSPLTASHGNLYGRIDQVTVEAAAFLHLATDNNIYADYVQQRIQKTNLATPRFLTYAVSTGARESIADEIKSAFRKAWSEKAGKLNAYRDPRRRGYHWSSNSGVCSDAACLLMLAIHFDLDNEDRERCLATAAGALHYIHGVNPTGYCYLTNMSEFGAEQSLRFFYHTDGVIAKTPPPGYMPGGPNQRFTGRGAPPAGQPPQKSFDGLHQAKPGYEYMEGQCQYQASYVWLLSLFATGAAYRQ